MRKNLESKTAESKVFDYDLDVVVEIMVSSFIGIYTFWLIEKPELSCESITKICGGYPIWENLQNINIKRKTITRVRHIMLQKIRHCNIMGRIFCLYFHLMRKCIK